MFLEDKVKNEYKEWGENGPRTIFFDVSTGGGKTTFILEKLSPYAVGCGKTVKIYVSRTTLFDMYEEWREEYAVENMEGLLKIGEAIMIDTYQALEERIRAGIKEEHVDYIVFDECHYFLTDSLFNSNTVLSYEYALNQDIADVRIFMSATGTRIFQKIITENNLIDCEREWPADRMHPHIYWKEYKKYVLSKQMLYKVQYYDAKISRVDVIKNNPSGKWVVYVTNQEVGVKLRNELLQNDISAAFICRKNKGEEAETFNSVSTLERFDAMVLITTAVVETGINFRDDVVNIMLESNFEEQFLQMLGRRRYKEGQMINLFIPYRNEKYFRNLYEECRKEIEEAKKILDYGEWKLPELLCKGVINFSVVSRMLYEKDGTLHVNMLSLEELIHCRTVLKNRIIKIEKDEGAFIKEQLRWLHMEELFDTSNSFRENIRQSAIESFKSIVLNAYVEKSIWNRTEKQKWLKELIPLVKEIDKNRFIKKGFSDKSFNDLCEYIKFGYCMKSNNKNTERKTLYWIEERQLADATGDMQTE